MTRLQKSLTATALGIVLATPVSAFEFTGAAVNVQYHNWYTANVQKAFGTAAAEFGLGENLFGQIGGTAAVDLGAGAFDFTSVELHLGAPVSETVSVGAFAGVDDYVPIASPFNYFAGMEAAFAVDRLEGEVFAGRTFESFDPDLEIFAGANLFYNVTDAFGIGAGAFYNSEPANWQDIYLDVSARYTLDSGVVFEGIYSYQPQYGTHGIGIRIGFNTRGGVTFGNRDFSSLSNSFY